MNDAVLCFSVTPAWQRILLFDGFACGEVNRAKEVYSCAAGKGVNTARGLLQLGFHATTTGFNGGTTGRWLAEDIARIQMGNALIDVPFDTRICTTLIDRSQHTVTEMVEETQQPDSAAIESLIQRAHAQIESSIALACCGTLPTWMPHTIYADLIAHAAQRGIPTLVDSHKQPFLSALHAQPLLAKLNVQELALTTQTVITDEASLLAALRTLQSATPSALLVTQGASAAYLAHANTIWRFTLPQLKSVVNPIGSGDSVNAGILAALLRNHALVRAVAYGLACGTANVQTRYPAQFEIDRVANYFTAIEHACERISCIH